jgi:opacity protein-like surface antigen
MSVPTLKPEVAGVDVTKIPVPALAVEGTDGRATAFTTNVRVEMPASAHLIPYVVGGGGVASVKEIFTISVPRPPGAPAIIPSTSETRSSTDLALTVGGGLSVIATAHVSIDVDLRYMRLLADRDLNVGRFGIGLGYRF